MPEHTPAPTPHRAVYGFAFYMLFSTLFIIYVLWVFLPNEKVGLTCLPDKYFAIFIPMLALVGLAFFAFFIYPAINFSMTPNINSITSIVDPALVENVDNGFNFWRQVPKSRSFIQMPQKSFNYEVSNCDICGETHQSSTLKQIPPLRFMDLDTINKELFK